ncbi:hypothetical protein Tco_1032868 [Tanacetum coccineum]|uniref:Tf2-1-like SH3-like domain-containing protein n=1 Tax=Tanacetum coccineum TaxID=301880 RepID=A0ABQ5GFC7_9ASTR
MLKVSPRKGVIRFGKQGKLNPRYIGPFKILEWIGPKCLSDESLVIPMKELRLDDKLNFVEEPVEIMDREVKQLKQSRIPIIKVTEHLMAWSGTDLKMAKLHSPSSSVIQYPSLHQGVAAESSLVEENPFAPVDNDPFINIFAPEPTFEALLFGDVSSTESTYVSQTLHHLGKWSKDTVTDGSSALALQVLRRLGSIFIIPDEEQRDEEEMLFDDNEATKVKALMALTDEERVSVSKKSAYNGEWVKISIQKVHTLLEMKDDDDRNSFLDYFEQIPTQKKKILGIDQLTKDTSSSGPKDLVFVKSSTNNSEVSITDYNKSKLSRAKDFTLSNHDTGKVPSNESKRNTIDHSVVVSDSLVTDYDSADESLVCSTPLPPLKKLTGAEHVSGPKTIKSILKSKSTFKAETLKGIIINEPSSASAGCNKSSSASKTHSAPTGKLKNVKMDNDPPLVIVMKELNELKLQISKKKSSYSRNKNAQQHHTGQGESSSRSRPSKPLVSFPSSIHYGYNNHHSNDCLYYPTCEICRSYDHNTHDHNDIKWFRKRDTLHAKNAESSKVSKGESSSALRSKTPTKSSEEKHLWCLSVARRQTCVLNAKRQQSVVMSSAEAEYVAAVGCCANILRLKSQLTEYDIIYEKVPIFCDNTRAIAISNNPVLHSRTKHFDIRYHFIRDHILKGDIELHFIPTQYQLADIFTKPLDETTFKRLIVELGMLNIDSKPEASVLTEEN